MSIHNSTVHNIISNSCFKSIQHQSNQARFPFPSLKTINLLSIVRQWLNDLNIQDPVVAHKICAIIPTQCPFARDMKFFSYTILRIPPLCKLNPFYHELVTLRFRALCFLADECGEDISSYY